MNHYAIERLLYEESKKRPYYLNEWLGVVRDTTVEKYQTMFQVRQIRQQARKDLISKYFGAAGESLTLNMENAYMNLDKIGGVNEAREIVRTINKYLGMFGIIATPRARDLYDTFRLMAAPQRQSNTDTNSHFNQQYETESLRAVYEELKSNGFFSDKRNVTDDWLYVHTGNPGPNHNTLIWLGTQSELKDLIRLMYDSSTEHSHKWAVTANCFVVEDGNGNQHTVKADSIKKQGTKGSRSYDTIKQAITKLKPFKAQ